MNSILVLVVGIGILIAGYVFYGKWLAEQWGVDPKRKTPAFTEEDGVDYVPAKAPVLMGHHFSSIAGAGPINGPIQAAVFGWVPVLLWVLIGGIFFGGVHDYGALFASLRHKGQSIGEVIADTMGSKAKKLFIVFAYLTLILVVAAFGSIVANTFKAAYTESGAVDVAASSANATTAMISILFIVLAVVFGFMVYRRNVSLGVSTIAGVAAIVVCVVVGLNFHPIYLSETAWMVIVGIYITVASVAPVWILLQPRDYLSSFLLYFMMIVAAVGVIGSALMGHASLDIPAFTGFKDTLAPTGSSLGFMFPALFVTIACGAISGFLRIHAGGPLNGITVTADSKGNVKGYVGNPDVVIPANKKGKLDVAGAVGVGFMDVIKDLGLKEPYVGQCVLQTSEIAEDLTYYFATSEQVPSSVGLGVLMNKDNTVRQAGGFIIQLMPFCDEKVIEKLEQRLAEVNSVTAFLDEGLTPEQILEKLLGDMDLVINDTVPTQFYCNCSRERVSKALIAVGRKELNEMIQEAKPVELKCHFCNSAYEFSTEDLKELLRKSK